MRLNRKARSKALDALRRGASAEEAAKHAGVSRASVFRWKRSAGFAVKAAKNAPAAEDDSIKNEMQEIAALALSSLRLAVEQGAVSPRDLVATIMGMTNAKARSGIAPAEPEPEPEYLVRVFWKGKGPSPDPEHFPDEPEGTMKENHPPECL